MPLFRTGVNYNMDGVVVNYPGSDVRRLQITFSRLAV